MRFSKGSAYGAETLKIHLLGGFSFPYFSSLKNNQRYATMTPVLMASQTMAKKRKRVLITTVGLQFANRDDFGKFCIALRDDRVSFALGGSLIIAFPGGQTIEKLPTKSRRLLSRLNRQKPVRVLGFEKHGRRALPNHEETRRRIEELLKKPS